MFPLPCPGKLFLTLLGRGWSLNRQYRPLPTVATDSNDPLVDFPEAKLNPALSVGPRCALGLELVYIWVRR